MYNNFSFLHEMIPPAFPNKESTPPKKGASSEKTDISSDNIKGFKDWSLIKMYLAQS